MHRVWEKAAEWILKDFSEAKAKKETRTRRIPALLLIIGGILVLGAAVHFVQENFAMSGAYCGYPDPYGR